MKDIALLPNPYDFSNPVSDIDLFVGRQTELSEIKYYLDHAKTAPRPINIAILGPRASGKTSLLNMTELEAKKRDFCTVRIDLDEGDAKTQLGFFYKIFDSIYLSSCEFGLFGGKNSKTYDVYLDMTNTYSIPEDKTFCPFLFPLQYAKATGSQKKTVLLSDNSFKKDLALIRAELKRPIIVIFDEGNVLAKSRVHLEKLRNIFMNTPGFMLVLTGTPDLFPMMDEVFSPIVRQFKKIMIGAFKDKDDTRECIKKPLEKIGLDPFQIFDFETYRDINEIHDLSGGRPYEIQLVCHILFRRIQQKTAKKIKLDLSVLEEVRKELETTQNILTRPIITKVRSFGKKQLSALKLLCACEGCASFDQLWAIEYIINGETKWKRELLKKDLDNFVKEGILSIRDKAIKFVGDDFDKIYTKYFAREQKINLSFPEFHLEDFWLLRFESKLIKEAKAPIEVRIDLDSAKADINLDIDTVLSHLRIVTNDEDIFVEAPSLSMIKDLYNLMFNYYGQPEIPIYQIKISSPWLNSHSLYFMRHSENAHYLEIDTGEANLLTKRVSQLSGEIAINKKSISVIPTEILSEKVSKSSNEKFRLFLAKRHYIEVVDEYAKEAMDFKKVMLHAETSYKYNPNPDESICNNLGYAFMVGDDLTKAEELFKKAIMLNPKTCLARYNLGVLKAKLGQSDESLSEINQCILNLEDENIDKSERKPLCIIILEIDNKKLRFRENRNKPDLLEAAVQAKIILENISKNNLG